MIVIQAFADVGCPFTHVGLKRFVERRQAAGRDDVRLHVRSWPLEIVNGRPLDPGFIAEEVDEIRDQLGDDVFTGFDIDAFPATSIPAMALAAAAYRRDIETGEAVSLELRDLCFEHGRDIADDAVLAEVAARHGIVTTDDDVAAVHADLDAGRELSVIGSPHFFTPGGGYFCPALDVSRADDGHLRILADPSGFDAFVDACFAA
jgi:predicted DsbA family dithiol-disulfide isomerase